MTSLNGFRMSIAQPNSRDAEAVKKNAYHDHGILIVSLDNPKISWADKELLKDIGQKIYGKAKR